MLGFLFRGLTAEPSRGESVFGAITAEARQPHWYIAGRVPDTIDGRFAVLATLTALTLVRLEATDDGGNAASVALTERFIEVMESEHRELGLGDPTLGKKVRKLVGSLSRRVALWRETTSGEGAWNEAVRQSLYREDDPDLAASSHSGKALKDFWTRIGRRDLTDVMEGKFS
jgi:cytochrome b pre-mRNA-processing protein 3